MQKLKVYFTAISGWYSQPITCNKTNTSNKSKQIINELVLFYRSNQLKTVNSTFKARNNVHNISIRKEEVKFQIRFPVQSGFKSRSIFANVIHINARSHQITRSSSKSIHFYCYGQKSGKIGQKIIKGKKRFIHTHKFVFDQNQNNQIQNLSSVWTVPVKGWRPP